MTSPSEVALRLKMMVAQNKQRQGQQLYDTFDQSGPLRSGMQQGFEKKKQQELLAQQGYQQERREQLKATIQQETQRRNQEAQLSTFKSMQDYLANMDTPKNQLEKLRLGLVKDVQSGKLSLKNPETLRRAQLIGLPVTIPKKLTPIEIAMFAQKLEAGEADIAKTEAETEAIQKKNAAPPQVPALPTGHKAALTTAAWENDYPSLDVIPKAELPRMRKRALEILSKSGGDDSLPAEIRGYLWATNGDEGAARDLYKQVRFGKGPTSTAMLAAAWNIVSAFSNDEDPMHDWVLTQTALVERSKKLVKDLLDTGAGNIEQRKQGTGIDLKSLDKYGK